MHTNDGQAEYFAQFLVEGAKINQEHVGRRLLHSLNKPVADIVRMTDFDPQHIDDMTYDDVLKWLNDHIVFNYKREIIGLFNGTDWMWEKGSD